jgi:hypothetical protein
VPVLDGFSIRDRQVDTHLWVIVSDPSKDRQKVVLVSITTHETHKQSVCVLEAGDHPRINHKGCVHYQETRTTSLDTLLSLNDKGFLSPQAPVSPEILARIREGVSRSRTIKPKHIDILLEQGVIE